MKTTPDISERINKVVRHIEQAIDSEMSLDDLAAIACFSPFHFQRIFKEVVGETPKQFIKRMRMEEAARIFAFNPGQKILEVAVATGYQSLESFSRAFKDHYSVSPDNFRKCSEIEHIRIIQNTYPHQEVNGGPKLEVLLTSPEPEFDNMEIEIIRRAAQHCVFLKTTLEFPDLISGSFNRIRQWSKVRELVRDEIKLFGMVVDYPVFTPLDKCRFLTCAAVDHPVPTTGLVSHLEIPAGRYARFNIRGGIPEIFKAATYLVHTWLPGQGYKIKLDPVLLVPLQSPLVTPFNENLYEVSLPVEPAV